MISDYGIRYKESTVFQIMLITKDDHLIVLMFYLTRKAVAHFLECHLFIPEKYMTSMLFLIIGQVPCPPQDKKLNWKNTGFSRQKTEWPKNPLSVVLYVVRSGF